MVQQKHAGLITRVMRVQLPPALRRLATRQGRYKTAKRGTFFPVSPNGRAPGCYPGDRSSSLCAGAYKDIADVMARQADLVEVVHHLKQVVCVKG